jgi:phenylpropionate dioxygenase-like ring-hydroxylating dioxygenase large terminal subunit
VEEYAMVDDPVVVNDWHPVAQSKDVPEGALLPVHLLEEDLVLWRTSHRLHACRDLCAHRGTRLSCGRVDGSTLVCPYHGWAYNGEGQCVRIPSQPGQTIPKRAQVRTYHVQERYSLIWVALGKPAQDVPSFPEWDDPTYRKLLCGPYGAFDFCGLRAIENFLDVAHFPFIHEGILGDTSYPEIEDYQTTIESDGVLSKGVNVYQPDPYGTGQGDMVAYVYRAVRPLTAYLAKDSKGPRFSIFFCVTPHTDLKCTLWMWMALNYAHETPDAELIAWQDKIVNQDIPIIQAQRPMLLPLYTQQDLLLNSDRTLIFYRKWLQAMGLRFGTVDG